MKAIGEIKVKCPVRKGKVRDVVELDNKTLLLVATDRISAFDVVMPTLIPGKGKILTEISKKWFQYFSQVPNPWTDISYSLATRVFGSEVDDIMKRMMVCRKARVIPIEFVVRGYMAGSLWKEYQESPWHIPKNSSLCFRKECETGPKMLKQCEALSEPIFTPATKAVVGQHDENISFEESVKVCAEFLSWSQDAALELMKTLSALSIRIYNEARAHTLTRGIIIADTKFEFGFVNDTVVLIDELLTPDSSRFWLLSDYEIGRDQDSYDKQILRNYLETLVSEGKWDKTAPAPELPQEIVDKIIRRYEEIYDKLWG